MRRHRRGAATGGMEDRGSLHRPDAEGALSREDAVIGDQGGRLGVRYADFVL